MRIDEASDQHIPDGAGRGRVRQMAEGRRRHRRGAAQGRFERQDDRRLILVVLKFVMKALHQLPARSELPRELAEDLVRLRRFAADPASVPGWLS